MLRSDIAAAAAGWINTPFVHGASLVGVGADCLGVVLGALRECGRAIGKPDYQIAPTERSEAALLSQLGMHCDRVASPLPGHLLLFRYRGLATHLGICTDAGFIHAYFPQGRVIEVPLFPVWAERLHSVWEVR